MLDKLWILDLLKKSSSVSPDQRFNQTPVRSAAAKLGESCFNFSAVDPALFEELDTPTRAGYIS